MENDLISQTVMTDTFSISFVSNEGNKRIEKESFKTRISFILDCKYFSFLLGHQDEHRDTRSNPYLLTIYRIKL